MSEPLSKCCGEPLRVESGDDGDIGNKDSVTNHYVCTACNRPSEPAPEKQERGEGEESCRHETLVMTEDRGPALRWTCPKCGWWTDELRRPNTHDPAMVERVARACGGGDHQALPRH